MSETKINVCVIDSAILNDLIFEDFKILNFNTSNFFPKFKKFNLREFLVGGLNSFEVYRMLNKAEYIDELFRNNNTNYFNFIDCLNSFINKNDIKILVCFNNIIHPEIIYKKFKHIKTVLGMIDDPYVTYTKTVPYAWAFSGICYITPSLRNKLSTKAFLKSLNVKNSFWLAHSNPLIEKRLEYPISFYQNKSNPLCYVGNPTETKADRLIKLKKNFKNDFSLHGRWRFKGYYGYLRFLEGKTSYPIRVKSISEKNKIKLYINSKIGINMHVSEMGETGNARMYDLPAYGVMQICDKSGLDLQNTIFKDGKEIVYYETINEAIEKIHYYLNNNNERIKIAKAGFERFNQDYIFKNNFNQMLKWALNIINE